MYNKGMLYSVYQPKKHINLFTKVAILGYILIPILMIGYALYANSGPKRTGYFDGVDTVAGYTDSTHDVESVSSQEPSHDTTPILPVGYNEEQHRTTTKKDKVKPSKRADTQAAHVQQTHEVDTNSYNFTREYDNPAVSPPSELEEQDIPEEEQIHDPTPSEEIDPSTPREETVVLEN